MASKNKEIYDNINSLRENLLDMSLSNRLLNFRPRKHNIEIVDENIAELFEILVTKTKEMAFLPLEIEDEEDYDETLEVKENIWIKPKSKKIPTKHKDLFLQTNHEKNDLQKKLLKTFREYNTNIEEQGYNSLFLALCFLEWKDMESGKTSKAPLILIPISISRLSVGSPFKIEWSMEDIKSNLSLQYKLKEQQIDLPLFDDFETKEDVYEYLAEVNNVISSKKDWFINSEIYLSQFQFKKFVMFKDLDLSQWSSDVLDGDVGALFKSSKNKKKEEFDENSVDELVKTEDVYHVLDADSSQIAVIEDIKRNNNLVVEGPPGTGKSQTIVNLIAELLANNKKVLFVSEKKAALDVVKTRLDSLSLGDYCLELHSNKANKKEVLRDLGRILERDKKIYSYSEDYHNFEKLKNNLNQYMDFINSNFKRTTMSIYDLIGLRELKFQELTKLDQEIVKSNFTVKNNFYKKTLNSTIDSLNELSEIYKIVAPLSSNIWMNYSSNSNITPNNIDDCEIHFNKLKDSLYYIINDSERFSKITGIKKANSISEIPITLDNLDLLREEYKLIQNNHDLESLISSLENYKNYLDIINPTVLDWNLDEFKNEFKDVDSHLINDSNVNYRLISDDVDFNKLFDVIEKYQNYLNVIDPKVLKWDLDEFKNEFNEANSHLINESNNKYRLINDDVDLKTLVNSLARYKNYLNIINSNVLKWDLDEFKNEFNEVNYHLINNSNNKYRLISDEDNLVELIDTLDKYQKNIKSFNPDVCDLDLDSMKKQGTDLLDKISALDIEYKIIENENLNDITVEYEGLKNKIDNMIIKDSLADESLKVKLDFFKSKSKSFFKVFNKEFKTIKEEFKSYYPVDASNDQIINDFTELLDYDDQIKTLHNKYNKYHKSEISIDDFISQSKKLSNYSDDLNKLISTFNDYNNINITKDNLLTKLDDAKEVKEYLDYIYSNKETGSFYFMYDWKGAGSDLSEIKRDYDELLVWNSKFETVHGKFDDAFIHSVDIYDYNSKLDDLFEFKRLHDYVESMDEEGSFYFMNNWNGVDSNSITVKNDYRELLLWNSKFDAVKNKFDEVFVEPVDIYEYNSKLDDLFEFKRLHNYVESMNSTGSFYFMDNWKGVDSNLSDIKNDYDELLMWNSKFETVRGKFDNAFIEPVDIYEYTNKIDELFEFKQSHNFILSNNEVGLFYFGDLWNGINSDMNQINNHYNNLLKFNELYQSGVFSDATLEFYQNSTFDNIEPIYDDLKNNNEIFHDNYSSLDKILKFEKSLSLTNIEKLEFDNLKKTIDDFVDNIPNLNSTVLYKRKSEEFKNNYTKGIISSINKDLIKPEAIAPLFEYNFANNALNEAAANNSIFKDFNEKVYSKNTKNFIKQDKDFLYINRYRVKEILNENVPSIYGSINVNSELGLLNRELGKKSRIKPIRTILKECKHVISDIKPCFMMSPISIAQYLNPEDFESYFDYIIFDEASQVRTADALGALLRGKNYVIMGDSKQLPPTKFFDVDIVATDENETDLKDLESILDLCKISFPYKSLKWHYRSKHESLISVSNMEFYNNDLFVFPSSKAYSDELGLKFEYHPETVYDKGRSASNLEEAKIIIKYAKEHFDQYGNEKSLGIATFSKRQQQTIEDEIERMLKRQPQYDKFFSSKGEDGFFVKNLENVQGDERDVILISVGYGFDKNHKLSHNFGPLNRVGGERRLNVLMTRAREKCVIFSNFKSSDLKVENSASEGVKILKTYLYFAEHGEFPSNYELADDVESDFEKMVYNFLTDEGYLVEKHVGCAGYKIDLAVLDKNNPDNYILGIECDGAPYHSSQVARDRDRLRQEILERLGWKFYRIWSADWYQNRTSAQKKLIKAIKDAAKRKKSKKTKSKKPKIEEILIDDDIDEEIEYKKFSLKLPEYRFEYLNDKELSDLIDDIIRLESPIHEEELYNRIKEVFGIKMIAKNRNKIESALFYSKYRKRGEFYYSSSNVKIRKRIKPKVGYITDDEITETVLKVLMTQYSLDCKSLAKEGSKLMGFKSLSKQLLERYMDIIYELEGEYIISKNGKYNII